MNQTDGELPGIEAQSNGDANFMMGLVATLREPALLLNRTLTILTANSQFYTTFKLSRIGVIGRQISEIENEGWNAQELIEKIDTAVSQKENFTDFQVKFSSLSGKESIYYLNGAYLPTGGNEYILLSFKLIEKENQKYNTPDFRNLESILAHAPAMICILRGPDYVFELANEYYYQLVGYRDIIGKTAMEAIPEAEGQGFFELLEEVKRTGKPYKGFDVPIKLNISKTEVRNSFIDFVYQPIFDERGEVDGIFVYLIDVTEKVLVRKKIEQSEAELREIIDTVPAMIWITNEEGKSIYLNKKWYEYTGQNHQEAEGFGWLEVTHPEDKKYAEDSFIEANNRREPYSATFRIKNKLGHYRWVIDRGRPKYTLAGIYEGMIGSVVDVHEEKIKEQLVRESEHRIRNIVEEATVATAIYVGKEMKIELANEAMIKLWGKTPAVMGKTLREALPELDGQPFLELLKEVFTTGNTYWGKEDKVDLEINGEIQTGFFNFTYKPLRNEDGEIYGILNMAVDVTELVRSKMLVKESEVHFRQMADLMPTKVTNADAEGNFIYYNEEWLTYTGLTFNELNERGWIDLIHPEERENFSKTWKASLESGNQFEMELRCRNKSGKYKWHLARAEAVKNDDGTIKMWIATNTEIQKFKEEEKRKGDFLKMVSHELKTPVTSIKGYVQLLLTMLKREDANSAMQSLPLRPSLERIDHQIKRLTRLISEMLDLSRIEENKLELQKQVFSLNDLVNETVQDIRFTNTQHHIEVIQDFKCRIFADKDRIGQVLINFITNAIKYSPESKDIVVRVQKHKKNQVSVSVKDQGIGIEKKNHDNIFKRFYRISGKSEETYAGFGIGLYLAKEIIQRHDGSITVKSKKGKGSDFCFILSVASEN